jgi:glycosyltransferase involved in cell wall biosynthesis
MNVLHINTTDFGGAANASKRIHCELLKNGIDSNMLFLYKYNNIPNSFSFSEIKINKISRLLQHIRNNSIRRKKDRYLKNITEWYETFTFPYSEYDITRHPLYKKADIIQLNWTGDFLDEPSFFKKNKKPVVWRMPDLYPCNGGFHYQKLFPFDQFKEAIAENLSIRKKALENANIFFVPISEWVMKKTEESPLLKDFPKQIIYNGIDLSVYKPYPQDSSRKKLGIPQDKKMLLFGASSLVNKRKGLQILMNAIKASDFKEKCHIYIFGEGAKEFSDGVTTLEFVKDEKELAVIYSAADLFVMPSLEEAFGQVTLEALSCGVPVISFPTGGSLDIIKNGFNGIIAEDFTENDLKNAIYNGLNTDFDKTDIRSDIENRFNIQDKAKQYLEIYQKLLSGN